MEQQKKKLAEEGVSKFFADLKLQDAVVKEEEDEEDEKE